MMTAMHLCPDMSETLSPEQAADLLGVTPRTIWRWVASGKLAGTRHPCRVSTDSVLTRVRERQDRQARSRPVLTEIVARDSDADSDTSQTAVSPGAEGVLAAGVLTELSQTRRELADVWHENGRLQAEVGRLEAELAQARREAGGGRRQDGHRVGVWGRIGLWLRG